MSLQDSSEQASPLRSSADSHRCSPLHSTSAPCLAWPGLGWALTPILELANLLAETAADDFPHEGSEVLHQGVIRFAEGIPDSHRHWAAAHTTELCPPCALVLVDWYDVLTSKLVAAGDYDRAVGIGRVAAVIALDVASVQANLGLAYRRSAETTIDGAERRALLGKAAGCYRCALSRAPVVQVYVDALQSVESTLGE